MTRPKLKQTVFATSIVSACLLVGIFVHLRHRIYFLWAFNQSVAEVAGSNAPETGVDDACIAAQKCTSTEDIRFVDSYCIAKLKEGEFAPGMVAFYVLLDGHDCLLDETVATLKTLALDPAFSKLRQDEFRYLVEHNAKKNPTSVLSEHANFAGSLNRNSAD